MLNFKNKTMKKLLLLTKTLLAVALLCVGQNAWADDITSLPFNKTWTIAGESTTPFDAGSVMTGTNVTALSVNNTTATAWFDSDTENDGYQPYTLVTDEEVTISFTAYHGWLGSGKAQGVKLVNSGGHTLAEYVYNVGSCNLTDVQIGGATASTFTAAYNCQSTGANGFAGNGKPYVTTAGNNPVITFTVRYDGYVTLNITKTGINNTYTGNLPVGWDVDLQKIQAYAGSNNADRTLAINNLSISSAVQERADYTVKYVDSESNPIDEDAVYSGVVGSVPTLISADKAARYNAGNTKKYVYASDDASTKTIAANGSTVVTVTFTTYEKYDYSVTNSMGETIESGSLFEDETKSVAYPKYAQYNGAYYVTTTPYQVTVSNTNKTPVVTYSASDVTQFVETTSSNWGTTGMTDEKYSGGVAYRGASGAKTMITAEESGVYKLTYAVCSNSTGTPRTLAIYKNSEEDANKLQDDLSITWSLNYINTTGFKTIDNISLNAGDAILFKGGDSNVILDYVALSLKSVAITPANAKSTYVTTKALDFTDIDGLDAYVATAAANGSVTLEEVGAVPAGTPLMLMGTAGTEYTVPVAAPSTSAPAVNMFEAGDGTTVFNGSTYDYILYTDGLFYQIGSGTVATNKAYLHCTSDPTTKGGSARALRLSFGDITSVANVEAAAEAKAQEGKFIENGKLVIVKNGVKYNAAGAQVK